MINWVDNIVPLVLSSLGLITAIGNYFLPQLLFKRNKKIVNTKAVRSVSKSEIKALKKNIIAAGKSSDEMVEIFNKVIERASDENESSDNPINKYAAKYGESVFQSKDKPFSVVCEKKIKKVEK